MAGRILGGFINYSHSDQVLILTDEDFRGQAALPLPLPPKKGRHGGGRRRRYNHEEILEFIKEGFKYDEICKGFGVSMGTVAYNKQKYT